MHDLKKEFWNEKYHKNDIGWDIGFCSTPLKEYFNQLTNKNLKILIPGCGNSYEATYLNQLGFKNVFVLDISENAIASFKDKNPHFPANHVLNENFFQHSSSYDLIIEQTFFCAIQPELRKKYVDKTHQLLNSKGKLVGLLFNRLFEGGPPFGGNTEEYHSLFSPYFKIEIMEESYNSIEPRQGSEVFIKMKKNV